MDADVLIIGAGASGLSAARKLHHAGARVLVLEARNRIGGRILTRREKNGDLPIELGAEFVHGMPESIFNLLSAHGIEDGDMLSPNFSPSSERDLGPSSTLSQETDRDSRENARLALALRPIARLG